MAGNRFNAFSNHGIGIGLRIPHYEHIFSRKPVVDWFEVISENFMCDAGRPLAVLDDILEQYRVVQHGVSMYFGSVTAPDPEHLKRLKTLVRKTKTPWLSDHLCWGSVDGTYTHDLLPLPYTWEAVERTVERVRMVQDYLEIPVAVENVSSYAEFKSSEMTEWEFLNEVVERADCGILLDVNNIYVSSVNHEFDPMDYVNAVPADRVAQIHIAGHSRYEKYILDTHDHPVIDPVWGLYARAIERCGPMPTLLEWDAHIPTFEEVHAEAKKAEKYLNASPAARSGISGDWPMSAANASTAANAAADSTRVSLLDVQRAMAAAVMMPLTSGEDMQPVAPDGRDMHSVAETIIAPNSRLSAFERLELYNRQYWYRLLDALADDFPALRAVLGPQRFESLSIAYLQEHPSRSFSLRNLGSSLVEWMGAHPEQAGRRHRLALDIARLEWAFVEAFDNAENKPLTIDRIRALSGESCLALQPHVRLLALDHPALDLVLALHRRQKRDSSEAGVRHEESGERSADKLPRVARRPAWVVAHRLDNSVYYRSLVREEFQTLTAIQDGQPLGQALEAGFAGTRKPQSRWPKMVEQWFANWAEFGWICEQS
jgi:uncharacterized protein